jgi:hypothetical protein
MHIAPYGGLATMLNLMQISIFILCKSRSSRHG